MPVWKEEKKEGGGSFLSYRTVQYLTLLSVWWSHPKRIVIKREKNLIRHRVRVNKKSSVSVSIELECTSTIR